MEQQQSNLIAITIQPDELQQLLNYCLDGLTTRLGAPLLNFFDKKLQEAQAASQITIPTEAPKE